jgi:hypothetical protein
VPGNSCGSQEILLEKQAGRLKLRITSPPMTHHPKNPASAMRHAPRRSACAAQARGRELERIQRLSVQERIVAALTIGARFSWLKPTPGPTHR